MEIRHNITFNLRAYGKNRDKHQIRMRVTYNGRHMDFATGSILEDRNAWDAEAGLVHDGYVGAKGVTADVINDNLRNVRSQMSTAFKFFEANDVYPTEQQLTDKFRERMTGVTPRKPEEPKKKEPKPKEPDFFKVFDEFMAECGEKNAWTEATFEKKLGYFKWFLKWATNMGYNTNTAYKTFTPTLKRTQKKIIYLTNEEMRKLLALEIPAERKALENVRDVLIFCCFSGLRHSDVFNLRRSDVKDGVIEVTTVKTADSLSIELNEVTKGILEKYKDYRFKGDKALPVICN